MELLTLQSYHQLHKEWVDSKASVGFVPTMGALHQGHLKLIRQALEENTVAVISIFVNPSQFNNQNDFESYPRNINRDLSALQNLHNLYVIHPTQDEVYPEPDSYEPMPLGFLGQIMEGTHRPGHFEGVVHVVHNLFKLVRPDRAYFGLKDFQQLTFIQKLVDFYKFEIEIISCETLRTIHGLALSSRNDRLDNEGLKQALGIFKTFQFIRKNKNNRNIEKLIQDGIEYLYKEGLEVEYLEIRDKDSLEVAKNFSKPTVCFIAAYCQGVRLIDNMLI